MYFNTMINNSEITITNLPFDILNQIASYLNVLDCSFTNITDVRMLTQIKELYYLLSALK